MRDELFRIVEMLDDWLPPRSADPTARAAAEDAALDALEEGASFDDAFRAGLQAYRALTGTGPEQGA